MTAAELREISGQFRTAGRHTDDDLVKRITAEVEQYREMFRANAPQLPPEPLDELLPLMGWLIYEASWYSIQRIDDPAKPQTADERAAEKARVDDLLNAARGLPWPEFAPRALGALRAGALAESKNNTEPGYDAAWVLHDEARQKYEEFRDSHGGDPSRSKFVLALDEVFLQLALAETGTACRTAERVIAQWSEDFRQPKHPGPADQNEAAWNLAEQQRWIRRIFRDLTAGAAVGERAIATGKQIERDHGFVDQVDEHRLTRRSALQNPGIMTARATSLLLALGPAMADLGLRPGLGFTSWQAWEQAMLRSFTQAYETIEAPAKDGRLTAMNPGFQRQLVHVRLNLALVKPGYDLPSARAADLPCLALNPLDDTAVEAMSEWLAGPEGRGKERGLGAATMPLLIRSVITCRGLEPDDHGYQDWRIRWSKLDALSTQPDRLERVRRALAEATE